MRKLALLNKKQQLSRNVWPFNMKMLADDSLHPILQWTFKMSPLYMDTSAETFSLFINRLINNSLPCAREDLSQKLLRWWYLDLENVCLDTKIMCLVQSEAEILPDFRKNSCHFKNPRWRPQGAWKKCKHCFSDSVGPNVSKNVYFSKSSKILNEYT